MQAEAARDGRPNPSGLDPSGPGSHEAARRAVARAGATRRVSGESLVAMLCAGALAPVVGAMVAGASLGPLAGAELGLVGSVGGNVLTEVITKAVDRVRGPDAEGGAGGEGGRDDGQPVPAGAALQEAIAAGLEAALSDSGANGQALRAAVAAIVRESGVVSALVDAVAQGDEQVRVGLAEGLAQVGEQFGEFAFLVSEVRSGVWGLEARMRAQAADRRAETERSRQDSLLLARVLETLDRPAAAAGGHPPADAGPVWSGCPYLGLAPFTQEHAKVFFGRRELTRRLSRAVAERCESGGVLLVVGASGAGKSSLLRAGLVPGLARDVLAPGSGRWPARVMTPTGSPLRELAAHLADVCGREAGEVHRILSVNPRRAADILAEGLAPEEPAAGRPAWRTGPRLVLVVDQFEELVTLAPSRLTRPGQDDAGERAEGELFLRALEALTAAPSQASHPPGDGRDPGALVIAALRSDYLDQIIALPGLPALAEAWEAGPFVVGPMSRAELRQVVTGPAVEAGLRVEPELVEAIIEDAYGPSGLLETGNAVLPLVSQAMAATWQQRDSELLTLAAYRRAGGLADAVDHSAQAVFDALDERQRQAARALFVRLTRIGPDGRIVRRPSSRRELYEAAGLPEEQTERTLGAFAAQRLLVLEHDSVRICHDVLLEAWRQLHEWLEGDAVDRILYSQLINDADAWQAHGRDSELLYRAGQLAAVANALPRWAEDRSRYPELSATAAAFLAAGRGTACRTVRRRRAIVAGLAALALTAGVIAGLAVHYAAVARSQHALALSRQLAAESLSVDPGDPLTARRLAVAAWTVAPTGQAAAAMASLTGEQEQDNMLIGQEGKVTAVAFNAAGTLLAGGGADGTVRVWNPATGAPAGPVVHPAAGNAAVTSLAFNPTGTLLAGGSTDGTVRVWNPATGAPAGPVVHAAGRGDPVGALIFGPDGTLWTTAESGNAVQPWNPATGTPAGQPVSTASHGSPTTSSAFSPDGRLYAAADDDGHVSVWDLARRTVVAHSTLEPGGVGDLAFSPNDERLAAVTWTGQLFVWNPALEASPTASSDFGLPEGGHPEALDFSANDRYLAVALSDGRLALVNPATGSPLGTPLTPTAPGATCDALAFSPGSTALALASSDGTVRLLNPATGEPVNTPGPDDGSDARDSVVLGPGARTDAVIQDGGAAVRLWHSGRPPDIDTSSGTALQAPPGGFTWVTGIAFSPDGDYLAVADYSTMRVRYVATGAPAPPAPFDLDGDDSPILVAFGAHDELLATVDNWTLGLWHAAGAPDRRTMTITGGGAVNTLVFSPDGSQLATGDSDGGIQVWSTSGARTPAHPLTASTGVTVDALAFSPDGGYLAAANYDGSVWLWKPGADVHSAKRLTIKGGSDPGAIPQAQQVVFSPDGRILAAAYSDGTVRLWNPATGALIGDPLTVAANLAAYDIGFTSDGRFLGSAYADGSFHWWPTAPLTDPYRFLCTEAGMPSGGEWHEFAPGEAAPGSCTSHFT